MLFLGNRIFGGIPKYKRIHFVVSDLSDAQKLIDFCTTGNTKNFHYFGSPVVEILYRSIWGIYRKI